MTLEGFDHWLKRARRGARFVYHRGLLMRDREFDKVVKDKQRAIRAGYESGVVALVQRRVEWGVCDYVAIKI